MPRRSIKEEKTTKKVKLGVKIEKRSVRKKQVNAEIRENPVIKTEDKILERMAVRYQEPDDNHEQKEERRKELIMWSGVSVSMFLIIGVWLYNTKQVFETARANNANQSSAIDDLRKVSEEIGKQVEEARKQADDLAASSTEATSTSTSEELGASVQSGVLPENEIVSPNQAITENNSSNVMATSTE